MPRTITDIIPPSRRRVPMDVEPAPAPEPELYAPEPPPPAPFMIPRRRFPWGTLLFALVVVVLVIVALYAFGGAKIEVTPTKNSVTLSASLSATPQSGDLPYETLSVQKVASTSVPAETTATVQQSAQGSITIYNTQSQAQQLITNTRFATASGLIFRIHQGVTVPAGTADKPGQVVATVYADKPGNQYNIGPSTFTVPGLQGSAAYAAVTAKSVDAFTGGFSGQRGTVSQSTDDSAHAKLQAALAASIESAVQSQVPTGYTLLPGALQVSYQAQPDDAAADGSVVVSEAANATAVLFPEAALARAVATQAVTGYGGQPVALGDVSGLTLAFASTSSPTTASNPLNFTLSGSTSIIWSVDPQKVASAVAGKSRAAARNALDALPEIAKAQLNLRPFWASAFPSDPTKIKVVVDKP